MGDRLARCGGSGADPTAAASADQHGLGGAARRPRRGPRRRRGPAYRRNDDGPGAGGLPASGVPGALHGSRHHRRGDGHRAPQPIRLRGAPLGAALRSPFGDGSGLRTEPFGQRRGGFRAVIALARATGGAAPGGRADARRRDHRGGRAGHGGGGVVDRTATLGRGHRGADPVGPDALRRGVAQVPPLRSVRVFSAPSHSCRSGISASTPPR